jgi:hypothetical protein
MTASTPEEIKAYRLLALRAGLKLEAVGMKMSKGRSAFSIVKKMTGLPGRSAKELLPLYEDLLREYGILSLKKTMMNPAHRKAPVRQRKGWKIQTGSGNGWSDIKVSSGSDFYRNWHFKTKPDAQSELNELARIHGDPESYRIVPAATEQDFDLYNPVHRKNPVRQRIAVSLSRSKARRNPYLESGADISKITDINRKAASMA